MTATAAVAPSRMPVTEIKIRDGFNVRQNGGGIDELAASIELLGVLVPVIVDEDGYLIAGHRRVAAAKKLELAEIPVVIDDGNIAAAAAENIMRQQLSPAEEAQAIQRMLEAGYAADGAAQALGMSKQLVTRRLAERFNQDPAFVDRKLEEHGVPILASDTTACFDARYI